MFIKKILVNIFLFGCRILYGIDSNKVIFESFHGKSYSDNPKAISECLHKRLDKVKIVWVTLDADNNKGVYPDYINLVDKKNSWKYYKELATASVFVTNFQLPDIIKSKKQFFIQTWHGDRAFKKVLHDSEFRDTSKKLPEEKAGFCDLAIAGSDYGEMQYRSAFLYKGTVLKEGTPRDDILVEKSEKQISFLKKKIGIDEKVKILLYAPTLRRNAYNARTKQNIQDIEIEKTLEALEKKYSCSWVCFVRAHSSVCGIAGLNFNERIIDVSSYEDMAELLLISDVLITDYSSSAGDFALLDRPVILYASDYEEYLKHDRGLYFDLADSPYYVAENQNSLLNIIEGLNEEDIRKNCCEILDFYKTNETGRASEIVVEHLISWMGKDK